MKILQLKFIALAIVFCCLKSINAQDIHYSHVHTAPLYFNPAMTGVFNGGNIRLVANGRSQWQSFTEGYNTALASADMKVGSLGSSILGAGLQLYSDRAGELDFGKTGANLTTSVLMPLSRNSEHFISFGMSAGLVMNHIDLTRLKGNDNEPNGTLNFSNSKNYFDLSAGGTYFATRDEFNYFYIGASVSHINKPNVSFAEEGFSELASKLTIHGGGSYALNKVIALQPTFVYYSQGAQNQFYGGTFVKFSKTVFTKNNKIHRGQTSLYAGAWARVAKAAFTTLDAIVLSMRADFGTTSVTLSLDYNISSLSAVSGGVGAPELSVTHIINNRRLERNLSRIVCPTL